MSRFDIGGARIDVVSDGCFRLDGGAMFGVVPKVLWERRKAGDERNRIHLALNCLLVRTGEQTVLVDTGIGAKWDAKHTAIYGIERPVGLMDELAARNLEPEHIDFVINTHLHFDHAGGNTLEGEDGIPVLAFPRARYVVQRGNLEEEALAPNELRRASYLVENFVPVREAARFDLVEGDGAVAPGIEVVLTGGHQRYHQGVLVRGKARTVFFPGDLVPTAAHVNPAYIMAYDHFPLETLASKKRLLSQAAAFGWILVLQHELHDPVGQVVAEGSRFRWQPLEARDLENL